jgi:hypothetical protein
MRERGRERVRGGGSRARLGHPRRQTRSVSCDSWGAGPSAGSHRWGGMMESGPRFGGDVGKCIGNAIWTVFL